MFGPKTVRAVMILALTSCSRGFRRPSHRPTARDYVLPIWCLGPGFRQVSVIEASALRSSSKPKRGRIWSPVKPKLVTHRTAHVITEALCASVRLILLSSVTKIPTYSMTLCQHEQVPGPIYSPGDHQHRIDCKDISYSKLSPNIRSCIFAT